MLGLFSCSREGPIKAEEWFGVAQPAGSQGAAFGVKEGELGAAQGHLTVQIEERQGRQFPPTEQWRP
jgi:hypothetical protein